MSARPVSAWHGRPARRLLWVAGVSLAAHVLVLAVITRGKPRPPPARATALSLLLRPATPAPTPAATGIAAAAPAVSPAPTRTPRPTKAARSAVLAPTTATPPVTAPAATVAASGIASWDVATEGAAATPSNAHIRGLQAVETPPAARLAYAITVAAPGAQARSGGAATLAWSTGADGYRLQLSGENGVMGELDSHGQFTDAGFVPLEVRGAGGDAVGFDWNNTSASFSRSGASAALSIDAQDRASMLMRLAGIGLAGASQLDNGIELQVAGGAGAATVRFDNQGMETVTTALGPIEALHLRQRVNLAVPASAAPRLDIWLAPSRGWLPVQLQVSAADRSVVTQTVTAIDAAP